MLPLLLNQQVRFKRQIEDIDNEQLLFLFQVKIN
jgi:hypothetical protein